MQIASTIAGVIFLVAAGVFVLGWLVPLIMGIVRLRRKSGGVVLTIVGGVWGVMALGMAGLSAYAYFGVYQKISPTRNAVAFDAAKYNSPTGKIILPFKGKATLVVSTLDRKKKLRLSGSNGELVAPVGFLKIESLKVTAKDSKNVQWTIDFPYWSGRQREVYVQADGKTPLDLTLTACISAEHAAPDVASFRLCALDCSGESYSIQAPRHESAPGFEVLSRAGEVLWKGKFQAG